MGALSHERMARELRHYLDHRLEGFSNGVSYPPSSPSNKTNGYAAARVPDWQLRQWLMAVEGTEPLTTDEYVTARAAILKAEGDGEATPPAEPRKGEE